jgi:hypothetical protein
MRVSTEVALAVAVFLSSSKDEGAALPGEDIG